MSEWIKLEVTDAEGPQDFTLAACESLVIRGTTGMEFAIGVGPSYPDVWIPGPFARASIYRGSGDPESPTWTELRRFRVVPWSTPDDWDPTCDAEVRISCLGLQSLISDQVIDVRAIYGQLDAFTIATTPEAALEHAIIAGTTGVFVDPAQIMDTGVVITQPTKNYIGSYPRQVVEDMSRLFDYLATPPIWDVKLVAGDPTFTWTALNTSPTYKVTLGAGITMGMKYDPMKVYNRVVAAHGKGTGVSIVPAPVGGPAVDLSRIPIVRDLALNLAGQQEDPYWAQRSAEGVLAKGALFFPEWAYTVTIPSENLITTMGDVAVPFLDVEEYRVLRLTGVPTGAASVLRAYDPPTDVFILEAKYVASDDTLVLTVGDPRLVAALAGGTSPFLRGVQPSEPYVPQQEKVAERQPIAGWTPSTLGQSSILGPDVPPFVQHATVPTLRPDPPTPPQDDFGQDIAPPETDKIAPHMIEYKGAVPSFHIGGDRLAEIGRVPLAATGVEAMTIYGWSIETDPEAHPITVSVEIIQKSSGAALFTATLAADSDNKQPLGTPVEITKPDVLIPRVSVPVDDPDLYGIMIYVRTEPLFPAYPDIEPSPDYDGEYVVEDWYGMGRTLA